MGGLSNLACVAVIDHQRERMVILAERIDALIEANDKLNSENKRLAAKVDSLRRLLRSVCEVYPEISSCVE